MRANLVVLALLIVVAAVLGSWTRPSPTGPAPHRSGRPARDAARPNGYSIKTVYLGMTFGELERRVGGPVGFSERSEPSWLPVLPDTEFRVVEEKSLRIRFDQVDARWRVSMVSGLSLEFRGRKLLYAMFATRDDVRKALGATASFIPDSAYLAYEKPEATIYVDFGEHGRATRFTICD